MSVPLVPSQTTNKSHKLKAQLLESSLSTAREQLALKESALDWALQDNKVLSLNIMDLNS